MKRVYLEDWWPESWKSSYRFDLKEAYGVDNRNLGHTYSYNNRQNKTIELLSEVCSTGAKVFDVAAAQGNLSLKLAELGYHVTWNDLRWELADYVQLKYEKGQILFAPGDIFQLKFNSLFDAVIIGEIIEHVAHPDEFLCKAAELVREGGYVIMTTPNGAYFKNRLPKFSECVRPHIYEKVQFKPDSDGHIFLLYPEEIKTLAEKAGLEIDKLILFTNSLTNGHFKLDKILPLIPRKVVEEIEKGTSKISWAWKRKVLLQMGVRFQKK